MTPKKLPASRKSGTPSTAKNSKPPIASSSSARKVKPTVTSATRKRNSTPSKRTSSSSNAPASSRKQSASKKARTPARGNASAKKTSTGKPASAKRTGLELLPEEVSQISTLLAEKVYTFGTVPHKPFQVLEGGPVIDYHRLWNYDHLLGAIDSLLDKNPGCNLFLFNDSESVKVSSTYVDFNVVHALITPSGELPPKCLQLQSQVGGDPLELFSKCSLDWVDINKLDNDPVLEKFSKMYNGRVFALHNSSRRFRNIDKETERLFERVRIPE